MLHMWFLKYYRLQLQSNALAFIWLQRLEKKSHLKLNDMDKHAGGTLGERLLV